MDNSIFAVTRAEYKGFIEQIKPNAYKVEEIKDPGKQIAKIVSKKTGKCLCSRVSYANGNPEAYYVFEMPEPDERQKPVPHIPIVLQDRQEVQKFFDAYFKMKKEKEKVTQNG